METEVLVIGGGELEDAKRVARLTNAPFPVLADKRRVIYEKYGLDKIVWAWQRSATIIVDKNGIVRYFHRATNPKESFSEKELFDILGQLQKEPRDH